MARAKKKEKEIIPTKLDSRGIDAEKLDEEIENWAEKPDSDVYEDASKLYSKILKCYENKQTQADQIQEYWNIYSCQPDENQQYSGNSLCYVPAVRDCVNARVKRTVAQLFPANYKHVDAVGPTGESPYAQISLLEHYIRDCRLKDTVRAMLLAGDVTGQWNLYVDWTKSTRRITEVIKKSPTLQSADGEIEVEDITADDEYETKTDEVITERPDIVPVATEDIAVYPPTCNDIEESTASCIRLRMSKEKIQQMIDEGVFVGTTAEEMVDKLGKPSGSRERYNPNKKRTHDAGIRTEGTYKYALIFEVHTNLDFGEGYKEPAYVYFAGENEIIGIIKNPIWSGKRPILSAPIERIEGSFFGISKIEPVKYLQWNLNDFFNMGQDSAQYALMPIVMTDPLAQPNYQSMVMGLAAVWLANPQTTQFAQFPALWKDSIQLCGAMKQQIQESMDVNEAMLGKQPAGRKNQAQAAQQAQAQETNIVDNAKRCEETILNPLLERMFELDRQFRTKELVIATMGEVGTEKRLQEIPPQAFGERYFFRWAGTSFQTGMQRIQQMISWMNVMRGIPPQQLNGRRLDITPILEYGTSQIFGAEVAPKILIDDRNLFTVEPSEENLMMHNGIAVEIHEADDDAKHIAEHQQGAVLTGDPVNLFRAHIQAHQQAMQIKQQKAQQPQPKPGQPGIPGGGQQPGVAGTPRPGAQPGQPRPQQPAGAIHSDQMADPQAQPR